MNTKKKTLYIGVAALLLLVAVLLIILISHAGHDTPAASTPSAAPVVTAPPASAPTLAPTPSPKPTPEPMPTEEVPSITPPAETIDPASGSDIVLTTAVPSTATDIDEEAVKELIEQTNAAEKEAKNTPTL